jgi:hypothetical protein
VAVGMVWEATKLVYLSKLVPLLALVDNFGYANIPCRLTEALMPLDNRPAVLTVLFVLYTFARFQGKKSSTSSICTWKKRLSIT